MPSLYIVRARADELLSKMLYGWSGLDTTYTVIDTRALVVLKTINPLPYSTTKRSKREKVYFLTHYQS